MVRQYSAGGVVFKKEGDQILWLLIRPNIEGKVRWQLPKGWINEGEKTEEAALREVKEEGGIEAKILSKIDSIKIFFSNTFEGKPEEKILKTITFYLMEFQKETPDGHDGEVTEIAWLSFEEARERLTFKSEKEVLIKAKEILENLPAQSSLL